MFHNMTIFLKKNVRTEILTEIRLTEANQALYHKNINKKSSQIHSRSLFSEQPSGYTKIRKVDGENLLGKGER